MTRARMEVRSAELRSLMAFIANMNPYLKKIRPFIAKDFAGPDSDRRPDSAEIRANVAMFKKQLKGARLK